MRAKYATRKVNIRLCKQGQPMGGGETLRLETSASSGEWVVWRLREEKVNWFFMWKREETVFRFIQLSLVTRPRCLCRFQSALLFRHPSHSARTLSYRPPSFFPCLAHLMVIYLVLLRLYCVYPMPFRGWPLLSDVTLAGLASHLCESPQPNCPSHSLPFACTVVYMARSGHW